MRRRLTFEHRYPYDPDRVFTLVSDLDTLDTVSRPWVQFHHLPSGPVRSGQRIDVALSLFGLLPARPYSIHVAECDPVERRLRSEESGMGVRRLSHEVEVRREGDQSVLIDRIDIDAGWMTPVAAMFAWIIYRWRHHLRLRLLKTD